MVDKRAFERLLDGYKGFRKKYNTEHYRAYRASAPQGQAPKIMMISCSDSRFNPAIVMGADLGEIFTLANVANLVPSYEASKTAHHSTSAALEYGVNHLKVEHVIIVGHSNCGGIKALMSGEIEPYKGAYSFIIPWVEIGQKAKTRTLMTYKHAKFEENCHHCERLSLVNSLENLQTFPWVKQALAQNMLAIHAWHFDIGSGVIECYDSAYEKFVPLIDE